MVAPLWMVLGFDVSVVLLVVTIVILIKKLRAKNNYGKKIINYSEEDQIIEVSKIMKRKDIDKFDALELIKKRNQLFEINLKKSEFKFDCPVCGRNNWKVMSTNINCDCESIKPLKSKLE
ncbi:hypothetical protein [Brevibacillus brevis]|uniref:hypothetical protein n=1 Tax=Brevibacillus brevis TaxID=1393 RepID=UPI0007D8A4E2|nr:hypothetical protein [Brevibacillus brevis]